MTVGVPKEIKDHETRVAITPGGVQALRHAGHEVLIERGAGLGSFIPDSEYLEAGAQIVDSAAVVWRSSEMVVKVKEPQPQEFQFLRPGLILFTYLHLAPLPELTEKLLACGVTAIGYETIRESDGSLPLLTPMSEIAGRLSVQIGAEYLLAQRGGRGILLGGVPGVPPATVVILGGGVAGQHAARIAFGMGARVIVIDKNLNRLRQLDEHFESQIETLFSNSWNIRQALRHADLVIGAVLVPGASAPKLITRETIDQMQQGAVFVDISIDQGGCAETSRPTSHSDPVYAVSGVLHYCVPNMPAAVPRTSTFALANATLPYLLELANKGFEQACCCNPAIAEGVNTYGGWVTHPAVAESQSRTWKPLSSLL